MVKKKEIKKVVKKKVKEVKPKEIETTKLEDQYIIQFIRNFNPENDDLINLTIIYNKELQKLIESIVVKKETSIVLFEEYRNTNKKVKLKRYKVKSWLYNSLGNNYKDLMFLKELIDTGKTIIKCDNLNVLNTISSEMRENIIKASNFILKNNGFKTTVKINIKRK